MRLMRDANYRVTKGLLTTAQRKCVVFARAFVWLLTVFIVKDAVK